MGKKEWTGGKGKDQFEIDDDDDFCDNRFGKKDKLKLTMILSFEDFIESGKGISITLDGDLLLN